MSRTGTLQDIRVLAQKIGLAGFAESNREAPDFSKFDVSTAEGVKALARAVGLVGFDGEHDAVP